MHIFDYTLTDSFTLEPNNRWMQMARCVPWELAEEKYKHMFRKNGRPAKQIRMALGSLIIQEKLQCSDEETVLAIMEQPYLQHFIGLTKFTNEAPFHASLMVWFRKRLSKKFMEKINDAMVRKAAQPEEEHRDDDDEPHGGTLIVDATCTPADIEYPTDTGLLAEAIEKADEIIDELHEPHKGAILRPRTYRQKSRRVFVEFVKRRKPGGKLIRKVKGKQLNFLRRNLGVIHQMVNNGEILRPKRLEQLAIIEELYTQQREMHQNRTTSVENRIVSLSQPHIRPIVRGKAGKKVEVGAKINMSLVNGYVFLDKIDYDNFHEGNLLELSILNYHERFGIWPSVVLADRAYVTRDNRAMCKVLGIRLMGKPLGRPRKGEPEGDGKEDIAHRVEIEGSFGTLKTRYGWDRIRTHLPETDTTTIWMAAFVMNLLKRARSLLRPFGVVCLPSRVARLVAA
jgi:hypothetical protein